MGVEGSLNETVGQVTVVGTGLLGVSLGLALRDAGYHGKIIGVGRQISTIQRAEATGGIDQGTTDLGPAVAASQLVVLATPVGSFSGLLETIAKHDHDDLVITDVGSTKQWVCAEAKRLLPTPGRFVGSHPMAGDVSQGPDHARADLYAMHMCFVTPLTGTDGRALRLVKTLWTTLRMKLQKMSPAEHDRRMALISHLPHVIATQLVRLAEKEGVLNAAGRGFGSATRLASGEPQMWADIFATNRGQMIKAINTFSEQLRSFRDLLAGQNYDQLAEQLRATKAERDAWAKQSGSVQP